MRFGPLVGDLEEGELYHVELEHPVKGLLVEECELEKVLPANCVVGSDDQIAYWGREVEDPRRTVSKYERMVFKRPGGSYWVIPNNKFLESAVSIRRVV